jgi:hypothetical protein
MTYQSLPDQGAGKDLEGPPPNGGKGQEGIVNQYGGTLPPARLWRTGKLQEGRGRHGDMPRPPCTGLSTL